MDEKDDDKKRVLTPPSEWADGLKLRTTSEALDDPENAEWPEDNDFQVPPQGMPSDDEPSENGPWKSNEAAINSAETEPSAVYRDSFVKLPWLMAFLAFSLAGGLWFLWSNERSTSEAEVSALQDTVRLMKRSEKEQKAIIKKNALERDALEHQIRLLEERINTLSSTQRSTPASSLTLTIEESRETLGQPSATPHEPLIKPPSQTGGDWFVNLESHRTQAVAKERLVTLRSKLLPMNISIQAADVGSQTYHRIRAAGFSSKASASKAADWIANKIQAGPFWVGKLAETKPETETETETETEPNEETLVLPNPKPQAASLRTPEPAKPVQLRSFSSTTEKWFIYVDTYDSESTANVLIQELMKRNLHAVSTIEVRSGEIFHSVQIIDLPSKERGTVILEQLRDSGFRNARIRKQIN